ncbi:MAG: helix-turn-helix domain-containing protein [Chloroflexi bacterium]|nr:helix-turn-helix domain-containing protein [Ktedonobacteraceae bacterium]MBV9706450.1 helix-turn-helix domain-containing protein [Chloroflexota bacterium]
MIDIGQVLRDYRKSYKLTQEQLAERLGVEPKTVIRWENGQSVRNVEKLHRYADLLGVSPVAFGLQPFRQRSPEEIDAVVAHGWGLMAQARYREARNTLATLLLDVHIESDDETLLRALAPAYYLAGHVASITIRTGQIGQAISYFQTLQDIARQIDDDSWLNVALTYHGDMLRRTREISKALDYLQGARDITPQADFLAKGNNAQLLARVYVVQGNMHDFEQEMRKAEEIAAGDPAASIHITYSLGTVYIEWAKILAKQGKMEEALRYNQLAKEHFPQNPRWGLLLKIARSEAMVYGGELEEGLKMAKEVTQLCLEQGDMRRLERIYGIKKYLRQQRMRFGRADDELEEMLEGQIE